MIDMLIAAVLMGEPGAATPVAKKVVRPQAQPATLLTENSLFDQTERGAFSSWSGFGAGYELDRTVRHTGAASARCVNTTADDRRGIFQTLAFKTGKLAPIVAGGWSKAADVSGTAGPEDVLKV